MAINPLIALQGQAPDIGAVGNRLLQNVANLQQLQQQQELAPLRKDILTEQLSALTTARQQAEANQPIVDFTNEEKRRIESVANAATILKPMLDAGDVEGAKLYSQKRMAELQKAGINQDETAPFLRALEEGNIDQANKWLNSALQLGGKLKQSEAKPASYKDVETVNGQKFGINEATGQFEQIPLGQQATIALHEQQRAKQEAEQAKQTAETQKTTFSQTEALRKEREAIVKPEKQVIEGLRGFDAIDSANQEVLNNFKSNLEAFADPKLSQRDKTRLLNDSQALSDVALMFSFFKVLDPASTVREGEIASATNSGGIETRWQNLYNGLLTGKSLNDAQRNQIKRIARKRGEAAQQNISKADKKYTFLAEKQKLDPELVVIPEQETQPKTINFMDLP